ncbi:MAG: PhzF family phenazine biosynthesis protein [Pseudomonadota bacterium]
MTQSIPYWHVDAFSAKPFGGNQAAVMVLDEWLPDDVLVSIGAENLFAETAFVVRDSMGKADWELRWCTPTYEIALCGHATLAAAKAIWATRRSSASALRFQTKSGELVVSASSDGWLHMDFPAEPASALAQGAGLDPQRTATELAAALSLPEAGVLFLGQNRMDLLVHVTNDAFEQLQKNDAAVAAFAVRGVIVTAEASSRVPQDAGPVDFVSRFFGPRFGISEDPVTGSAHCALAPYWAAKLGKDRLVAWQASDRGGLLRLENRPADGRVTISGQATVVMEGRLGD